MPVIAFNIEIAYLCKHGVAAMLEISRLIMKF